MEQLANRLAQSEAAREAFRDAAGALAVEAGIIPQVVDHGEGCRSLMPDAYSLMQMGESKLRFRKLSVSYEKLRAAAIGVLEAQGSLTATAKAIGVLRDET
jgi:hypothetical protein